MTTTIKSDVAPKVSIHVLPNSPLGWMSAQLIFNQSPQTTHEFFGHDATGREGRLFFERILADTAAAKVEIFEIVLLSTAAQSVGLMTLGSGYAGNSAAYIHFMFVVDSHRGIGIGFEAVKQLETYALKTSNQLTLVSALPENRATHFWKKLGFEGRGGLDANLAESCHDSIVEKMFKQLNT